MAEGRLSWSVSRTGPPRTTAAGPAVRASGKVRPEATQISSAPPGKAARLMAAETAQRSGPSMRVTVPVVSGRSWSSTEVETARVPPTTTIRPGRSRSSSALVGPGRLLGRTKRTGPPERAATGPVDRASGKSTPLATWTTGVPTGTKRRLAAAAVA